MSLKRLLILVSFFLQLIDALGKFLLCLTQRISSFQKSLIDLVDLIFQAFFTRVFHLFNLIINMRAERLKFVIKNLLFAAVLVLNCG